MGCVRGVRDPGADRLSAKIRSRWQTDGNSNKHNHSKHMRRSTVRGSIGACDPLLSFPAHSCDVPLASFLMPVTSFPGTRVADVSSKCMQSVRVFLKGVDDTCRGAAVVVVVVIVVVAGNVSGKGRLAARSASSCLLLTVTQQRSCKHRPQARICVVGCVCV